MLHFVLDLQEHSRMSSRQEKDWMYNLLLQRRKINFGTAHEKLEHPHEDALRAYVLPKNIKVKGDPSLKRGLQRFPDIPSKWDPSFTCVRNAY